MILINPTMNLQLSIVVLSNWDPQIESHKLRAANGWLPVAPIGSSWWVCRVNSSVIVSKSIENANHEDRNEPSNGGGLLAS